MSKRFILQSSLLALLLVSGAARAAEFIDMVRDLTALQNRIVAGDEKARELVARQFDEIEAIIPELAPDEWVQQRNTRAAIIYLLGGGTSAALRELYEAGFFYPEDASLVEASLLYAEGAPDPSEKLKVFDPRAYPPVLGGHLALVQGGALLDRKNTKAIESFDIARLLMPTSLVEEAAIRREIRALDPEKSAEKIHALAQIYVRKYPSSPYARNFWAEIRALIFRTPRDANLAMAEQLSRIIDQAPSGEQFDLKAAIFRSALLNGKMNEAALWLDKSAEAATSAQNTERVSFYRSVMHGLSGSAAGGETKQLTMELTPRNPDDQLLKDLAMTVMQRIDVSVTKNAPGRDETQPDVQSGIEKTAHALIDEVDELLRKRELK